MLKIERFALGALETNAYLILTEDEKRGVIIDPGMDPEPLLERIVAKDWQRDPKQLRRLGF